MIFDHLQIISAVLSVETSKPANWFRQSSSLALNLVQDGALLNSNTIAERLYYVLKRGALNLCPFSTGLQSMLNLDHSGMSHHNCMDTAILPHNQTSNKEALIALTCPYKGGALALSLPNRAVLRI